MSEGLVIYVTVGLPGSGKTTWAVQYIDDHSGTVRINKDTLRFMFWNGDYTREEEDFVCTVRDNSIELALVSGFSVVIDDTNLHPKHIIRIKDIAERHNATVEIQDFTDKPLWLCIQYDKIRKDKESVGEDVILRMYSDHFEDGKWKYRNLLQEGEQ